VLSWKGHVTRMIFWDVDTQYDFMHADGKLYVPDAEQVIPNLKALTAHAHEKGIRIVASADDHSAGDREISDDPDFVTTYPQHCMHGTPGQRKIAETELENPLILGPKRRDSDSVRAEVRDHRGDILFLKREFDVFSNPNVEPVLDELAPEMIVLYGVALDVCNRYAIEGLRKRRPQARLCVVTDAAKPIVAEKAQNLLRGWKESGVELTTTAEALALSVA
jgi:nicotinamidase/pyrazinamidase